MGSAALGIGTGSRRSGGSRTVGILLIVAGVLAIFLPMVAGVAITALVGWLVLLGGLVHLYFGWHSRTTGAVLWQLVISFVYLAAGVYMILHPARGLLTLTLLLAIYFVVEGVMELATYFTLRRAHVANGFLWNGLITLVLGVLIWAQWPFSSVWALGTIIGISLVMSGIARLSFRTGRPVLGGTAGII